MGNKKLDARQRKGWPALPSSHRLTLSLSLSFTSVQGETRCWGGARREIPVRDRREVGASEVTPRSRRGGGGGVCGPAGAVADPAGAQLRVVTAEGLLPKARLKRVSSRPVWGPAC